MIENLIALSAAVSLDKEWQPFLKCAIIFRASQPQFVGVGKELIQVRSLCLHANCTNQTAFSAPNVGMRTFPLMVLICVAEVGGSG